MLATESSESQQPKLIRAFDVMVKENPEVIIVGAGMAGLTAARLLCKEGINVVLLEARERLGGRVYTHHDSSLPIPVELGAEFIHGRPHGMWEILDRASFTICDVTDSHWYLKGNELQKRKEIVPGVDKVVQLIEQSEAPDQSLEKFIKDSISAGEDENESWAMLYIENFHAARKDRISTHNLVKVERAASITEGNKQFRILNGYDSVVQWLLTQLEPQSCDIRLNTVVKQVQWRRHYVETTSVTNGTATSFTASRILITLPLGVLKSPSNAVAGVRFIPELTDKQDAVNKLEMGAVVRLTLCFQQRFWEQLNLVATGERENMESLGFLHTRDKWISTWWTMLPVRAPLLVGWVGGSVAEALSLKGKQFILECALGSLENIFGIKQGRIKEQLTATYMHDWQSDPFTLGSYSYIPVGGTGAQEKLASSVADTIFFAGEATNCEGHNGTVHGAIATGARAAHEILQSF